MCANCTITTNVNGYGARNPFRYRGYYFDTDLNMYYLTTRYYDPQTGRFINADAIEYLKPDKINGLNLYAYCKNNPVMSVDPTGHEALTQDEISDILCGAALIVWALLMVALRIQYSESINLDTSNIWEDNYFAPDLDWNWITPDPSTAPRLTTDGATFFNCPVSICEANLFFDANKMHSLYVNLLSVSVFAGFDVDENMYGFFVDVGLLNIGYDGRYIDIGTSGIGAGLGLGWKAGELVAAYDPVGYWGLDVSIDFAQMAKDLFRQ